MENTSNKDIIVSIIWIVSAIIIVVLGSKNRDNLQRLSDRYPIIIKILYILAFIVGILQIISVLK